MPPIRIPETLPFPLLGYDPDEDALLFDFDGIGALVDANHQVEWSEDLLMMVLANWYLRDLEAGRLVTVAGQARIELEPVVRH